jgi:hypothetical protein
MKNFQKEPMPKKKSHPVADQFSDDEMDRIKRYGEALGGKPTPFDEEVEMYLQHHEANYAKMRAAQTGDSLELAHSDMEKQPRRDLATDRYRQVLGNMSNNAMAGNRPDTRRQSPPQKPC